MERTVRPSLGWVEIRSVYVCLRVETSQMFTRRLLFPTNTSPMQNSWPADLRVPPPISARRKGKRKEIGEYVLRRSDAPLVEFGIHAAATLINVDGQLKWDHIRPEYHQQGQYITFTHR